MDSKSHSQPGGETEGAVDLLHFPTPAPFPEHLANLEVEATADPDLAGDPVVEDISILTLIQLETQRMTIPVLAVTLLSERSRTTREKSWMWWVAQLAFQVKVI